MPGRYPELTNEIEEDKGELDTLLLLLLLAVTADQKRKLLDRLNKKLRELQDSVAAWLDTGAKLELEKILRKSKVLNDLDSAQIEKLVKDIRAAVSQSVAAAVFSIRQQAAKRAKIDPRDSDVLQDDPETVSVEIIGSDGRIYRYDPDYYLDLAATMAIGVAATAAVLIHANNTGNDLVQISPNPSTIGDFCDAYRGKVFSVSGTHPFYYPLSWVPNGGPPMHIWCRHYLLPYEGPNLEELRNVPGDILEVGRSGAGTNEIQKLWLSRGR